MKATASTTTEAELPSVRSEPLLALVRFLAKYQSDLNDLRDRMLSMTPEECEEAVLMQWPVVRGTGNQIALRQIGELHYDVNLVAAAVKSIRANVANQTLARMRQ